MKPKYRKTVAIVTYAKEKNKVYFLVLKRKLHWKGWEFPKGGIEKSENIKQTVKRELKEETGLKPIKIKKFFVREKYKYHKILKDRPGIIGNQYKLYAVEVKKRKVRIDKKEHSTYRWLEFKRVIKTLKWPNQKKCLKIVDNWLRN